MAWGYHWQANCPEVLRRVAEMRSRGYTHKEVAKAVGCSLSTAKRLWAKLRPQPHAPPAARDAEIRRLRAEGLTLRQIAARTGWGVSTAGRVLRRGGKEAERGGSHAAAQA